MADLYQASRKPISLYKDRRYGGDLRDRELLLKKSTTIYVGNLSFYTREEQIFDLFSRVGEVKRIIMGLDRIRKTPCGFCFVEYFTRPDAEKSVHFISGMKLDERTIRVDYDIGYSAGRQYGRGRSGGQVRDEYRADYDPGRGGYGKAMAPQTGMDGMEMWGPQAAPPTGPKPIHPGMRMGHPRGGRGHPRGRVRGRRGGRPDGYGGGRYQDGGGGYDARHGHGPPMGMKRRREYGDGGDGDGGHPSAPKRSRDGPGYGRGGNGVSPGRGGPPPNEGASRMEEERSGGRGEGANGDEPVRNARFERGKKDDAE